jgi:hypothetical protein
LAWGLMLITINSHGQTLSLGSTTFWWVIQAFILFLFFLIRIYYTPILHIKDLFYLKIYLLYVLISFIRGVFIAEGYWDWKNLLSSTMSLFIPILAYATHSSNFLKYIIRNYIFYTAPLFLVLQFYIGRDEFGFFLAPFSYMLLFIPILPFRWKILLIVITLYVIFSDLGARSNVIKFSVPLLFSLIYFFRNYLNTKILNIVRLGIVSLPLLFFGLAVSDTFNFFNPFGDDKVALIDKKRDFHGNMVEDDLTIDTRTFLYVEVLSSAKKYNSWFLGRSPARGNFSESFGEVDMGKRNERQSNEVSILNYFTWLGLIGIGLIFVIFYQASNLAINYSNNIFSKIMGLFIAFKWAFAWIEDVNNFQIQHIYLWLFIGFSYSRTFRQMSNIQMKNWVLSIFESQYYPKLFSSPNKPLS